jgi:hypothetical protein
VVDIDLILCPGGGVSVAIAISVGITVAVSVAPGIVVGVAVLAVLLGVANPTSSSPSTAPKAAKRSTVTRSSPSSPCSPQLRPARYSSTSMEVRSTGTELLPPRCLGRGGRNRGGLDAI